MHHSSQPPACSRASLADQPHGAGEDRPVAFVARRLRDREEVLVGVVEPAVERRLLPVAVVLRRLDEPDRLVGEERGARAQEAGVELVVGVDHADQLGARVDHLPQREVERTGLVAGPVGQVGELHAVPEAPGLDRPPQRLVVGVVVDHDDLVRRVVDRGERLQRLDHHLGRFVVRRHLEAHEREPLVGHRPGCAVLDAAGPGLTAQRVAELPEVRDPEERGERLHQPEHQGPDRAGDPEVADEGPPEHVGEVGEEEVRRRRPGDVCAGAPVPGHRQPDGAHREQPGDAGDGVRPGRAEQHQDPADERAERQGGDHGERDPAGSRPHARRTPASGGGREEWRGCDRRGHETRQQEGSQHGGEVLSGKERTSR